MAAKAKHQLAVIRCAPVGFLSSPTRQNRIHTCVTLFYDNLHRPSMSCSYGNILNLGGIHYSNFLTFSISLSPADHQLFYYADKKEKRYPLTCRDVV